MNDLSPIVWGGIGDKRSNNGTQWFEQDRIYDADYVATAIPAEKAFHPYYKGENEMKLRIRKLTPCECIRLMAFTKEDYQAMKDAGMSDSQIYHCAGDSIVATVLMGIFGSLTMEGEEVKRKMDEHSALCKEGLR